LFQEYRKLAMEKNIRTNFGRANRVRFGRTGSGVGIIDKPGPCGQYGS